MSSFAAGVEFSCRVAETHATRSRGNSIGIDGTSVCALDTDFRPAPQDNRTKGNHESR